jgi:hypothetical protein
MMHTVRVLICALTLNDLCLLLLCSLDASFECLAHVPFPAFGHHVRGNTPTD